MVVVRYWRRTYHFRPWKRAYYSAFYSELRNDDNRPYPDREIYARNARICEITGIPGGKIWETKRVWVWRWR